MKINAKIFDLILHHLLVSYRRCYKIILKLGIFQRILNQNYGTENIKNVVGINFKSTFLELYDGDNILHCSIFKIYLFIYGKSDT